MKPNPMKSNPPPVQPHTSAETTADAMPMTNKGSGGQLPIKAMPIPRMAGGGKTENPQ